MKFSTLLKKLLCCFSTLVIVSLLAACANGSGNSSSSNDDYKTYNIKYGDILIQKDIPVINQGQKLEENFKTVLANKYTRSGNVYTLTSEGLDTYIQAVGEGYNVTNPVAIAVFDSNLVECFDATGLQNIINSSGFETPGDYTLAAEDRIVLLTASGYGKLNSSQR